MITTNSVSLRESWSNLCPIPAWLRPAALAGSERRSRPPLLPRDSDLWTRLNPAANLRAPPQNAGRTSFPDRWRWYFCARHRLLERCGRDAKGSWSLLLCSAFVRCPCLLLPIHLWMWPQDIRQHQQGTRHNPPSLASSISYVLSRFLQVASESRTAVSRESPNIGLRLLRLETRRILPARWEGLRCLPSQRCHENSRPCARGTTPRLDCTWSCGPCYGPRRRRLQWSRLQCCHYANGHGRLRHVSRCPQPQHWLWCSCLYISDSYRGFWSIHFAAWEGMDTCRPESGPYYPDSATYPLTQSLSQSLTRSPTPSWLGHLLLISIATPYPPSLSFPTPFLMYI